MYKCTLVGEKGYAKEIFFREGESVDDILEGLNMFCWPSGKWLIEDPEDLEDE